MKTKFLVRTALLGAAIAIVSPISIPLSPVPISLCTFALCLVALSSPTRQSALATLVYILLGTLGLPVFSLFRAGFSMIFSPTGGYIIGYIPMVLLISFLNEKAKEDSFFHRLLSCGAGSLCCYLFGTVWFMFFANTTFLHAISVCVVPFLFFDFLKISVASMLAPHLREILEKKA